MERPSLPGTELLDEQLPLERVPEGDAPVPRDEHPGLAGLPERAAHVAHRAPEDGREQAVVDRPRLEGRRPEHVEDAAIERRDPGVEDVAEAPGGRWRAPSRGRAGPPR